MQYELFYLIGASNEGALEKIKKETEKIVEEAGGKFLEKITVEKRRLSYEIGKETHGIYIARRFELEEGEMLNEITKKLNLNSNILRFIISRASELPELKSKEERMNETVKTERPTVKEKKPSSKIAASEEEVPEKKEEVKEVVADKKEKPEKKSEEFGETVSAEIATSKEETESDDDIDKKLEEILNI